MNLYDLSINAIFSKYSLTGYLGAFFGLFASPSWIQILSGVGGLIVLVFSIYKLYLEIQIKKEQEIRDKKQEEREEEEHKKKMLLLDKELKEA